MKGSSRGKSSKAGLPPGTPVYVGERKAEPTSISVIDYTPDSVEERKGLRAEDCLAYRGKKSVSWINVDGLGGMDQIRRLCDGFGIHPLVVEDIFDTQQRPKAEDYGDYIYVALKMPSETEGAIEYEHLSLVLGNGYVISFQESAGDGFDPLRERIRKGGGRSRKSGSDYLAYAIIDSVVDSYFSVLEGLGERMEGIEGSLISDPASKTLGRLMASKKEMILLRRAVWPMRDAVSYIERTETPLVKKETRTYLRDVYDHTIEVMDNVEMLRDISSGMLDVYLSSVSNRLNEVMKVLTVIATIFIPLTFIVGVYGMNFKDMPELSLPWGYPAVLLGMFAIALGMLYYFRKRKWV